MGSRVGAVRKIGTITANRGEQLIIKLGKTYRDRTLTAWMKKDPTDTTYRSFVVTNGNTLTLTQEKASDYYSGLTIIESVSGAWYYDVEFLADGDNANLAKTVVSGKILFINDVTNSVGVEVGTPNTDGSFTRTSDLVNDGEDGTSTFVEVDQLAAVATSGAYSDLSGQPLIPTAILSTSQITNQGADNTSTYVENDELSTVAISGAYSDLSGTPTIPSEITTTNGLTNEGADGASTYVEHDELAEVATNGMYSKLNGDVDTSNVSVEHEIDWNVSNHILTMTGNTVFTQENMPASGVDRMITVYLYGNFSSTDIAIWGIIGEDYDPTNGSLITAHWKGDGTYHAVRSNIV